MKDIKEYIDESIFDKDIIQKDLFPELNDLGKLFEDADTWNDEKKDGKFDGTYFLNDVLSINSYVCMIFGFILQGMSGMFDTKTKPNFDNDLKRLSIIQYLADKFNIDPIQVINYLKDSGHIKIIKMKELLDASKFPKVDKNAAKWVRK